MQFSNVLFTKLQLEILVERNVLPACGKKWRPHVSSAYFSTKYRWMP